MASQTQRSISLGMGKIGEERLKLYLSGIAKRGYNSLSAYIVDLVDRELGINLPKPKTINGRRPSTIAP